MLCHSVTSQGFGALHFCEIGYEAVMGFVVVAVVVAVVVVEGQSEKGHCVAQHKRLLVEKMSLQLLRANPPILPKCFCDTDAGEPPMKKWSDMKGKGGKKVAARKRNDSALVFEGWHLCLQVKVSVNL